MRTNFHNQIKKTTILTVNFKNIHLGPAPVEVLLGLFPA